MSLKSWIEQQLASFDPQLDDVATVENAAIVTELKHRTLAAGLFELSLSLPIEPRKYPVSAVAQLRRALAVIEAHGAAPVDSELLTVKQAAQRYQFGVRTIYRMIETGALSPVRVGRSIRLKPADFDRFLEDSETAFR